MRTFNEFNISQSLKNSLKAASFNSVYEIQQIVIPKALKGENILCLSPTASGKTLTFLVPLINNCLSNQEYRGLIIVPTIELLTQIISVAKTLTKDLGITLTNLFTENKISPNGLYFATPSKIIQKINQLPNQFDSLVIDEVDFIIKDGFLDAITIIISRFNFKQYLFLSATIKNDVKATIKSLIQTKLVEISLTKKHIYAIDKYLINAKHHPKEKVLLSLLKSKPFFKTILFASTIETLVSLSKFLTKEHISHHLIHSNLSLNERKTNLNRAISGNFDLILVSDALSRGIDFLDVTEVISYDLPKNLSFISHREGRTGRSVNGTFYQICNETELDKLLKQNKSYQVLDYKSDNTFVLKMPRKQYSRKTNENLQKELNKVLKAPTSKEVKPNYKKKIKKEKERIIKRYRDKMIKDKIRQSKNKGEN